MQVVSVVLDGYDGVLEIGRDFLEPDVVPLFVEANQGRSSAS